MCFPALQPKPGPAICQIDDFQPLQPRITNSIICPAAVFGEITDTHATVVYQMAVSFVHTAAIVFLSGIDYFICLCPDLFVFGYVFCRPFYRMRMAGQNQDQPYVRVLSAQVKDGSGCQYAVARIVS